MTSETTSGVTKTYSYDAFDRMTSVAEGESTIQTMSYGPDGRRLSVSDANGTRKFFYDGDDVIQVYNSDWASVTEEFTRLPTSPAMPKRRARGASAQSSPAEALRWVDEPLSMTKQDTDPSQTYYLMKDRLGSIINILDSSENVKTTYSYDAFGEPTATYHSGQIDCMFRFTGRAFDSGLGNYFYRARYYNQSLGRFFSRDPLFGRSAASARGSGRRLSALG